MYDKNPPENGGFVSNLKNGQYPFFLFDRKLNFKIKTTSV